MSRALFHIAECISSIGSLNAITTSSFSVNVIQATFVESREITCKEDVLLSCPNAPPTDHQSKMTARLMVRNRNHLTMNVDKNLDPLKLEASHTDVVS